MTPRFINLMLAAACVFLGIALAVGGVGSAKPSARADLVPRDLKDAIARERLLLDRPIRDVRFDGMPLEQAFDILAARSGVNIRVNWKSLDGAGIDRNAPVTLHLTRPTFRQALKAVSIQISPPSDPLEFLVQDNIVFFSTFDDFAKADVTEIYNIRDLVHRIGVAHNARSAERWSRQDAIDSIIKVIYDKIDGRWLDHGSGTIREQGGLLITHSLKRHEAIAALLEKLSAADRDERIIGEP